MHDFAQERLETARTGTSGAWNNTRTGARGFLKIVSTDSQPGRPPCREYEWSIVAVDGQVLEGRGQGCRISGGQWSLDETQQKPPLKKKEVVTEKDPETPPLEKKQAEKKQAEKKQAVAEEKPPAAPKPDPIEALVFTLPPRTVFARDPAVFEQ